MCSLSQICDCLMLTYAGIWTCAMTIVGFYGGIAIATANDLSFAIVLFCSIIFGGSAVSLIITVMIIIRICKLLCVKQQTLISIEKTEFSKNESLPPPD